MGAVADDQEWDNYEVKTFTFESEDDDEAKMIEIPASVTGVQDLFSDLVGSALTATLPAGTDQHVAQEIMVQ